MLKAVNSPYLCNSLTDFDEIWHEDAYCPPPTDTETDRPRYVWTSVATGRV